MELAIYILSGVVVIQMAGAFIAIRVIRSKEKESDYWNGQSEMHREGLVEAQKREAYLEKKLEQKDLEAGKFKDALSNVYNDIEQYISIPEKRTNFPFNGFGENWGKFLKKVDEHKEELRRWRRVTSKQVQRCKRCGRLHKADKEILGGAMPGDTLCGGDKCKTYG